MIRWQTFGLSLCQKFELFFMFGVLGFFFFFLNENLLPFLSQWLLHYDNHNLISLDNIFLLSLWENVHFHFTLSDNGVHNTNSRHNSIVLKINGVKWEKETNTITQMNTKHTYLHSDVYKIYTSHYASSTVI